MKNFNGYLKVLELTGLFKNIKNNDIQILLNCFGAVTQNTKKNKILLLAGESIEYIGIVLSGRLNIIRESYSGNRALLGAIRQGGIFAENFYCSGMTQSPVTVIAAEDSNIMKLNINRPQKTCSSVCLFQKKLTENMLNIIAGKNLILQNRMEILELKTIREKVLLYLETFKNKNITLPFNRQEMADYLNVERSALSHELIKMKKDGLINYKMNKFTFF